LRPLPHLKRRNDEPLVFDGDTNDPGLKPTDLDPSSGELHPRKGERLLAHMEGQACRFLLVLKPPKRMARRAHTKTMTGGRSR
jgi:hypothetical protein